MKVTNDASKLSKTPLYPANSDTPCVVPNPMHILSPCSNGSPLPITTSAALPSALIEWKIARKLLANAVQSYLASCSTLRALCTIPLYQPSQRTMVEKLLTAVDSELESLVAEEHALHNMRVSLLMARNNLSSTLVPVNTLPPEILVNIFSLSMTRCVRDDREHLHNFTGVCAYWRQVAMNAVQLWSHIDIGPGAPDSLANMLLERTKNAPIHVHLHEPKRENNEPTSEQEVSRATKILLPHVHRIRSLDIESYSYSRGFVGALLNLWLEGGDPSLARSLVVYRPNASMLLSPDGYSRHVTLLSRSDNAKRVLQSLGKLHLQNVLFDLDSGIYRGLVNLQLSCFCAPTSVCISQIATLLTSNPALSTLKLSSLALTCPDDWIPPAPIALNNLKVLNLFHLNLESLQLFMPLVRLPAPSVEIGIGPAPFNLIHSELKGLLARSNVTALYCWQDHRSHSFPTWMSLLDPLPTLHNVVLDEFHMTEEPVADPGASTSQPLSFPCLPSVLLLDCTITLEGMKALVTKYGIQNLRFERCKLFGGEDEGLKNTRASLLEACPELNCIFSSEPSTGQLEYCRIFDR